MSECKQETMEEAVARYVAMSDEDRIVFDRIRDPEQQVVVGKDDNFTRTLMLSGFILKTFGRAVDEWLITPYAVRMLDTAAKSDAFIDRYYALMPKDREVIAHLFTGEKHLGYLGSVSSELLMSGLVEAVTCDANIRYFLTEAGELLKDALANKELARSYTFTSITKSKIGIDLTLPVPKLLTAAGFDLMNISMERFHDLIGYMSKASVLHDCGMTLDFVEKDPSGVVGGIPVAAADITDAQFYYIVHKIIRELKRGK